MFDVLLDVEFVGLFVVGAGVLDVHTRPHQLPIALWHGGGGGSDRLVLVPLPKSPREQGGPGGRAYRRAGIVLAEAMAFAYQRVEVWGLDVAVVVGPEISVTHLISVHQLDVGSLALRANGV